MSNRTGLSVASVVMAVTLSWAPVLPGRSAKLSKADQQESFRTKVSKDLEALHALNRLTYGPRPGDPQRVLKMGVKKWIDLQLRPERIRENRELERKLQPLVSLAMTDTEIVRNYPPPQMVVAVATGRAPLPADPEQRAVLERLARRYKDRLEKKGPVDENFQVAEKGSLRDLLSPEQLQIIRNGTPGERIAMLQSLPADRLGSLLFSLPQGRRRELLAVAPVEIRRKMLLNIAPQQVLHHDLVEGKLYRAVYSERQLQEVLSDFWFNHFNVYLDKGADRYLTTSFERDAIRPHVLGKFRSMLQATAEHPAMLFYLDNWQSVSPDSAAQKHARRPGPGNRRQRGLNENYARELLELHTLGVDGGYTQKDIVEIARCFTGWSIRDVYRGGGGFYFNERVHDTREKKVVGVKIPEGGGKEDGLKVLDILAEHPSTARFVATKLAQRFVADAPPSSLVDTMAKTFNRTGGDLREVMKTMLNSREFWSQGAYRAKIKSPLEMVVSAVRATDANVTFAYGLAQKIADLGQPLYRKQEPTGYSNTNEEWVNSASLLARMNFATALTGNQVPGARVDETTFTGEPEQVVNTLLFTRPSDQTQKAIQRGIEEKKEPSFIAGLVIGSPEFQRR